MAFPFEFPGLQSWEGSRTRLLTLSEGLADRGTEVHILCKGDPAYGASSFKGISLHALPELPGLRLGRYIAPALYGMAARSLAEAHGIDIVHSHLPIVAASVALWKPLIRSKIVFDTHDWFKLRDEVLYNVRLFPRSGAGLVDASERIVVGRYDGVLVTTERLREVLGAGKKTFVVPNAVDTSLFKPGRSAFRETTLRGSSPVVGFLGNVSRHQGFWELMDAFKAVSAEERGATLLAVGGGEVEEARKYARGLGIADAVVFTGPGRVPAEQVPDMVNAMDVAVSPLQREPAYQEYAQPLKVLEYLACGVPVVVTPLTEQEDMVRRSGGGVVAAGFGGAEIAAAVLEALRGKTTARRVDSSEFVSANFATEIVIKRLMGAYEAVIG